MSGEGPCRLSTSTHAGRTSCCLLCWPVPCYGSRLAVGAECWLRRDDTYTASQPALVFIRHRNREWIYARQNTNVPRSQSPSSSARQRTELGIESVAAELRRLGRVACWHCLLARSCSTTGLDLRRSLPRGPPSQILLPKLRPRQSRYIYVSLPDPGRILLIPKQVFRIAEA